MPTRLLREGILSSDRVDQLDYGAEVFYRRLMSKVDDYGLYDARIAILRATLYPLRVDRVREADISRWIAACEKAGLIALYQRDGKPFLQMMDTRWSARSEAKFPVPGEQLKTAVNGCEQRLTGVPVVVVEDVVEDEVGDAGDNAPRGRRKKKPQLIPLPESFGISDRVRKWAAERGHDKLRQRLEHFVSYAKRCGKCYADWDEAFMTAIREDWAKLGPRGPDQSGMEIA